MRQGCGTCVSLVLVLLLQQAWRAPGQELVLRKCCPRHFIFNIDTNRCQRVNRGIVIDWLPDQLVDHSLIASGAFMEDIPREIDVDPEVGPCPGWLAGVASPILVEPTTNLQLTNTSGASLSVMGSSAGEQWCVDAVLGSRISSASRRWVVLSCPCLHTPCVARCCYQGYRLSIRKASANSFLKICPDQNVTSWQPSVENLRLSNRTWRFRFWTVYEYSRSCLYSVREDYGKTRRPKLIRNFTIDNKGVLSFHNLVLNSWSYCVGESFLRGKEHTVAMYCDQTEFEVSFEAAVNQSILAGVGGIFTALTLLVHSLNADLRQGVKGLSLIAHCAAMLAAYAAMASRPLAWEQSGDACTILGVLTHCFMLSAFFWLNVRAIIIHATFRSLSSMLSGLSLSTRSFPIYALYAVGVPVAISGFMAWAQFADEDTVPSWIIWPDIDPASCWFKAPLGRALYFSLPMGLLILINVCLFFSTLIKINAFKRENQAVLNSREDRLQNKTIKENIKFDTKRLKMFAKLSLLMGLTYLSEFFSWFNYLFSFYWYASNVAIAVRAILIFMVFCCNKKVLSSLRKQWKLVDRAVLWVRDLFAKARQRKLSRMQEMQSLSTQDSSVHARHEIA